MTELPNLSPQTINAYNRFCKEIAAFHYVLGHTKMSGPVKNETIIPINAMIHLANRLFRRHADLPRFFPLGFHEPISHADLTVLITRLTVAALFFEKRYAHLTFPLLRQSLPPSYNPVQ